MRNLRIPDSVMPYLRVQKGEINHIEDNDEFKQAYIKGLNHQFDAIQPYIPAILDSSLDIGSGVGGIDILLQKKFNHAVYLLDAVETDPICTKHDVPFNSSTVTREYFIANNSRVFGYIDPEDAQSGKMFTPKFDLIHSVGSYCFHYSPVKYLNFVKASCHESTVLIFDVRNTHPDWLEILRANFDEVAAIVCEAKFTKRVFKVKK